ncbi:MAG: hypothetical protein CHACPFDD_03082 [Phycisphaerae bacterium]|nr:hypothetical protein [Phycisphaerae bacterium]
MYLSRHGSEKLGLTLAGIGHKLGIRVGTLKMRMSNFKWIDGRGGLSKPSKQSHDVGATYGGLSEPEMRGIVMKVLGL